MNLETKQTEDKREKRKTKKTKKKRETATTVYSEEAVTQEGDRTVGLPMVQATK